MNRQSSMGKKLAYGFTLVELLGVILIITILVGLSMVGVGKVMETRNNTAAKQQLAFIEEAFDEFFVKYNRMPADLSAISDIETDENDSDGKNLMLELTGGEGDDLINVNRVNFLKMDDAANQNDPKNGFTRENGVVTGIYDPWGQAYKIQFDDDYDDKIMPEDFSDEVVSGVKFLISSRGKDGAFGTMDDVLSWD